MKYVLLIIFFVFNLSANSYQDMYKRDVNITKNKKIVCLGPGCLRLITYMQVQDRLSAIEKTVLKFNPNSIYTVSLDKKFIKTLPIIGQGGPGKMPNLETLITINPDIIFTSLLSKEQVELIEDKTKIPVLALSYGASYGGNDKTQDKLEAVKSSLRLIGNVMQKEKRAEELISFMNKEEDKLKEISNQESNQEKKLSNKKNIYIGGIAYKGLHGITSTESDYPAFKLLNIENSILKNHKGHAFINEETLLMFNPDLIFLDSLSKKIVKEEIKKNENIFNHINAFKNKNIHWLYPSNFSNTNIENIYINSWLIASHFGHDIDMNIDMNLVKKRIYSLFLGEDSLKKIEKLKVLEDAN